MKAQCERCSTNLQPSGEAYICSYECTYCPSCASHLNRSCPNCGGELIRRPRRFGAGSGVTQPSILTAPTRRWLIWAISFGAWGVVLIGATASIAEYYSSRGAPMEFWETVGLEASQILPYALLTPFVFAFATRYPFQRRRWLRSTLLYLTVGLAFSLLHITMRGFTPFATWIAKTHTWHAAFWEPGTHKFAIDWPILQGLFFSNVVDDITEPFLAIVLSAHMISFYRTSRERERRAMQLEGQLTKANLQALKAQLQPHFLFNTMHSISALMMTDTAAADKMMSRLSDLLRMSLEDGSDQVTTLSRELEFVNGYLEIEKVRYGDRLNVVMDVAAETLDAQVPHLLLQPLVENAIRHGIAKMTSGGEIRMISRHDQGSLCLTVCDNGPGFADLNRSRTNGGVGLRATQERLRTLYGEDHSVQIKPVRPSGAEVAVRIPFRTMSQDLERGVQACAS